METSQSYTNDENISLAHLGQFQRQLPTILIGQQITALVLAYLVQNRMSTKLLLIWIFTISLVLICRTGVLFYQGKYPNSLENRALRIRLHAIGAGATASMWGVLAFHLINPHDILLSLIIVMVSFGLVAASVASTANLRSVFLIYSTITMFPAAVKFLLLGGAPFTFVGVLILSFLIIVSVFEKGVHNRLTESIRLKFENDELISNLTDEKTRADESRLSAEQALSVAENANKAKSQFLAAASHDLRQPLHAIRLLSSTLENTNLDKQQQPIVDNISSSVQSLEELFNSLLDISKLDSGTQSVQFGTAYLGDVFSSINRTYASIAAERGIEFSVKDTESIVHTDIVLLERLLSNLVSNAIRYTPAGKVEIFAAENTDQCSIVVRDTGIGISGDDQRRVFDEFVQLDNPERDRTKGIGLGLAIVKRTATLLDLPLTLVSEVGSGTTISVVVPTGHSNNIEGSELSTKREISDFDNLLVLIVDDELSVRTALEGLLESWGCVALIASDGSEAIQVIREVNTTPDAIIADLRLRDNETGIEVIKRVQNFTESNCPAVIITGDIDPGSLRELQNNLYPMLHKPCDPEDLRQFLGNVKSATQKSDASAN